MNDLTRALLTDVSVQLNYPLFNYYFYHEFTVIEYKSVILSL